MTDPFDVGLTRFFGEKTREVFDPVFLFGSLGNRSVPLFG